VNMLVGNAAEGTIGLMLSPTGIIVTPVELEPEPFSCQYQSSRTIN